MINKNQVLNAAKLSRLELSEAEIPAITAQLGSILEYIELLNAALVDGIEPACCAESFCSPLRDDIEQASLALDKILANGPAVKKGHFAVPKIIGQAGGGV
ncbi:MAG: Asp-tRNA(Asn)/Glu-tRNA(Gln) amidotransferase subunit GatC [Chitinispirillales bacterium]|jgi:aspartyl-tRNA(Asn)/glutamyl-tRNA(Gln) amidotransferase subunit C|nr:Asp-tRNA(Asn)/Glu-tRNA(Gln) amidotransferase subunit GatC [Chitinispirillales bacterium]